MDVADFVLLLTSITIGELVTFSTGAFFATGFLMVDFGAGFLTGVFFKFLKRALRPLPRLEAGPK